jgi:DNA-binding NtrC family response regulator
MSSLLQEMLEVFDYESERASDGPDALNRLETDKFALVITDLRMPNMSGMELLSEVKTRYPNMPVVLISGYSINEANSMAGQHRADGFLGKPLMMSDIEKMLNTLL